MSEVDVAVRRAQAALRKRQIHLTAEEWNSDEKHRRICKAGGVGCDKVAHHYSQALPEGRVYVDGNPVIERDGRWVVRDR